MRTRGRPRQFDRQQALDHATRLFWTNGFNATSVEDLLKHMGINRGSLYATYGDKRSLFIEAVQNYTEGAVNEVSTRLHGRGSARQCIRDALVFSARVDKLKDCRGCLLTHAAVEVVDADDDIRAIVRDALANVSTEYEKTVSRGIASGEFIRIKDPKQTAAMLATLCHGLNVLCKAGYSSQYIENVIDNVVMLLD